MKLYSAIALIIVWVSLGSCGSAIEEAVTPPFTGKVQFKGRASLFSSNGEILFDAGNQKVCYKIDAIKNILGIDIIPIIDVKNQTLYMYNPEKKIYSMQNMDDGLEEDMVSNEEIEELKTSIQESFKATGNIKEIAGFSCEEYVFEAKELGAENVVMWVNKKLLDQMGAFLVNIPFLDDYGLDGLLVGFPMQMKGTFEGQVGSFEVTNITESKDVLAQMTFEGFEKVDEDEFLKIVIAGTPMEGMMNQMLNINIDEEMEMLEEELKEMDVEANL